MTFGEFQARNKKKTRIDRYWYYILCVAIIVLSLAYLYFLITQPGKFKGPIIFFYSGFFFLLFFGCYGLYLLPKRYKIVILDSDLPIEKKQIIVKKLIEEIGEINLIQPSQYLSFNLKRKWWQSKYHVLFFYDEYRFAFSVQGHDHDGGFMDLGETERKRKMIINKLNEGF